jgi:hypothetical protein
VASAAAAAATISVILIDLSSGLDRALTSRPNAQPSLRERNPARLPLRRAKTQAQGR